MPEKVECRYCGRVSDEGQVECPHCGGSLSDGFRRTVCDKCGHPLAEGIQPIGACVTCGKDVYLCRKHSKRVVDDEIYCKEHESECFIATAVFGTPLDPHLDTLREWRDVWLLGNPLGKAAVLTYYEISPPIARAARRNATLKHVLRKTVVEPGLKLARTLLKK